MEDEPEIELLSSPIFLLRRALEVMRSIEFEDLEQQIVESVMQDSMDSYHDALFTTDTKRELCLSPFILHKIPDNDPVCRLCLGDLSIGDEVVVLPCEHCFHTDCTKELVTHKHAACPLCRASIPIRILDRTPSPPSC